MFKQELRLKRRSDFLLVREKGKVFWGKYLGVAKLPAVNLAYGFVVSKKVMSRAVDRNRFRRLVYQAMCELDLVNKQKDKWVVFIAKSSVLKVSLQEIKNEISNLVVA